MILHLIGYWDELDVGAMWIDPNHLVGYRWDSDEKEAVIEYLRSGARVIEEMGYSWCRIDPAISEEQMGCAELTDGYWLWPEGLAVYLDRFDIELPDRFLNYIRDKNYLNICSANDFDLDTVKIDSSYWRKWCSNKLQQILLSDDR